MSRPALHRTATVSAVVAAFLAIPAVASAHPGFNPNQLPVGEAVEATLVVPHGCAPGGGMPDDGAAEPTVELAVQHTDGVALEPGEVDGWEVTDDGEAWVWSDDGGATTDVIELPVTLRIDEDATAGEEIYLRAFQECADGSAFQWVGTPDEEASFPAIKLAATEGEVDTTEPTEDHGDMEVEGDEEDMDMSSDDGDTEEAAVETPTDDVGDTDEEADDDGEEAAVGTGLSTPLLVLAGVLLLAAVAGFVVRARSS